MLLETGANHTLILVSYARNYELRLVNSKIKNIQLTGKRRIPVQHVAALFQIKLGTISSTVARDLMKDRIHNVVAGLDWNHHKNYTLTVIFPSSPSNSMV